MIKHITQTGGGIPDAMGEMQPAEPGFYRSGTLTVFQFIYRMVDFSVHNEFPVYDGFFHTGSESKSDATSLSGFDKSVLRPCIKSIFSLYKFRMQYHITLLG